MIQKNTWKQVKTATQANIRPSPRWGHCCCVVNDQIVLFGGYANSIYLNDLWVFNTTTMEWKEIKSTGNVPSNRSNCSLNYDSQNNRLVMFGGGGQNKRRFNQINLLDWETKQWSTISFEENETAPWERTYHSAQLLYPYLVIFGGEGMADLDDLWAYNFETSKWQQITFKHNAVRPCGRRFHSSCLIGRQFFVIAGCYSKYRPLNDIYSIDLTQLIQTGSVKGLQWKQRILNEQGFLTRWGQSTAVQGNNIYIFGGRFSNDLNDMLIFDAEKNKIRVFKVPNDQLPKPRRRSSLNFIGNCLLMFGGFNSDYYNDLYYINITQIYPKPKKIAGKRIQTQKINNKDLCDIEIQSNKGQKFPCHKGVFMQYIKYQDLLTKFIDAINRKYEQKQLQEMLQCVYKGYGKNKILNKFLIQIPEDLNEKQANFNKFVDQFRNADAGSQIIAQQQKKSLNQNIIQMKDSQFEQYIQQCQQNYYKDIIIEAHSTLDGNTYRIATNKVLLANNCRYFENLFSSKFTKCQSNQIAQVKLCCEGVNKLQIIIGYLITGHLVVPSMDYASWIELYKISDYLSLVQIQNIIVPQIYQLITQVSLDRIYQFSQQYNLQDLSLACARFKLYKNCLSLKISQNNKYYQACYQQNRFEIKQELMTKNPPLVMKHKISNAENMEDEKENIQTCGY